jgi:hypothetical protein
MRTIFLLENLKGRDCSEDTGVDGRIMDIEQMGWEGEGWMHLAQDRDQ